MKEGSVCGHVHEGITRRLVQDRRGKRKLLDPWMIRIGYDFLKIRSYDWRKLEQCEKRRDVEEVIVVVIAVVEY